MTTPKDTNQEIRKILEQIVEREHKYHTTDYDGVVGVIDEDVQAVNNLIESVVDEIIGKDEIEQAQSVYDKEVEQTFEIPDTLTQERNQLRKEQRDIKSKLIDGVNR